MTKIEDPSHIVYDYNEDKNNDDNEDKDTYQSHNSKPSHVTLCEMKFVKVILIPIVIKVPKSSG